VLLIACIVRRWVHEGSLRLSQIGIGGSGLASALAAGAAISAGVNGAYTGARGVYNWESLSGYEAFALDSTWGIVGTTLGNLLNTINTIGGAEYSDELSRRQNRQVFLGGFAPFSWNGDDYAHVQGNVISNLNTGADTHGTDLRKHENSHILQSRLFGPLFQAAYIGNAAHGLDWGLNYWAYKNIFTDENPNLGDVLETTMYRNGPFEQWSYRSHNPESLDGVSDAGYPRCFFPVYPAVFF
jgi:hypothetical protein